MTVFPPKENFLEVFGVKKPIIGMIHLKPIPGSPHYKGESLDEVLESALQDARMLKEGGVDGLVVENAWDLPFAKPEDIGYETVAAVTYLTRYIIEESKLPVGINILANGVIPSLAVAKATGALFVRSNQWVNAYVANEGFVEGASAKALRYRSYIRGDDIKIFADVHVKHGSHAIVADRPLADQTRDNVFFDADVLIATGSRTGDPTNLDEITGIKENTDLPVIIGSGLTPENAKTLLRYCDGAIVGSSLKEDGCWWNPVEQARVERLMEAVSAVRNQ
jgi:membrane complex biogenesis BtpA family protein